MKSLSPLRDEVTEPDKPSNFPKVIEVTSGRARVVDTSASKALSAFAFQAF
jgi:hypothetical protein